MSRWFDHLMKHPIWIPRIVFILCVLVGIAFWRIALRGAAGLPLVFYGGGVTGVSWVFSWLIHREIGLRKNQQEIALKAQESNNHLASIERRLEGMLELNRHLVNAHEESELIQNALDTLSRMTGAIGSTFVPFDEWGQPLTAFTHGLLPAPVLKGWAEHISSPTVRNICKNCQRLEAGAGETCPLLDRPPTDTLRVYCIPLERNERMFGMVNLYFQPNQTLSPDLHAFLEDILQEMGLAIEMVRLRSQELATLRQIQMSQTSSVDLVTALNRALETLMNAIEVDGAILEVRVNEPGFQQVHLVRGEVDWLNTLAAAKIGEQIVQMGNEKEWEDHQAKAKDAGAASLFGISLGLPGEHPFGFLLFASKNNPSFLPHQRPLIHTVANQMALLIDKERNRISLEYRMVMQERTRLAREIHDSLAQTLAYLKLSAAQMQNHLAQGDLNRLDQALKQSYQALSEAYLDTRQAIDNLRLTPQVNITQWLRQMAEDFRTTTHLKVILNLPVNSPEIAPEIQAQLMRIMQEGLSNIRKHAQAEQVWLNVRVWNQDLIFELVDDGMGFTADEVPELSRHGLRGMRERAELIGADFQVVSQPGQGTTIRFQIPLALEEPSQ